MGGAGGDDRAEHEGEEAAMTGDDDRLAYIRAIIRHRVPEATDADIALIAQP